MALKPTLIFAVIIFLLTQQWGIVGAIIGVVLAWIYAWFDSLDEQSKNGLATVVALSIGSLIGLIAMHPIGWFISVVTIIYFITK